MVVTMVITSASVIMALMRINGDPILKTVLKQLRQLLLGLLGVISTLPIFILSLLHDPLPGPELLVVEQTRVHDSLDPLAATLAHLLSDERELLAPVASLPLEILQDRRPRPRVRRELVVRQLAPPDVAAGDRQHDACLGPLAELCV